jgi:hypothetical protein
MMNASALLNPGCNGEIQNAPLHSAGGFETRKVKRPPVRMSGSDLSNQL